MKRVGLLVLVPAALTACAQLLSYDDYSPRSTATDGAIEPADVAEAATDADDVSDVEGGDRPARVPSRPPGATTPSGKGKTLWLAVRRFKLGSIDLSHTGKDSDAWKSIGFDLDGKCTTLEDSESNAGMCLRPAGAAKDSLVDGDACRDNNFGHHVGTMLRTAAPLAEPAMNDAIEAGSRTWILRIDDVDVGDDGYAPGRLYDARDERHTGVKIAWDGNDVRTALDDSVTHLDLDEPRIVFPNGYVSGDQWVSNDPMALDLFLPISGDYIVPVKLSSGTLVLQLDADRTSGHSGTVAGALPSSAIEDILRPVASFGGFCPGTPIYKAALASAQNGLDLSVGAMGLQDPTETCDGISFGVGFDVRPIAPVTAVDVTPNQPEGPCDAG